MLTCRDTKCFLKWLNLKTTKKTFVKKEKKIVFIFTKKKNPQIRYFCYLTISREVCVLFVLFLFGPYKSQNCVVANKYLH